MAFLKKYWPHIASVAAFALPFLIPSFNAYIAANPHTTEAVLLSAILAAYHSIPPSQK